MSNLLTATVKIRGTRPIIWHAFGPDSIPLEKQERRGVPGNDPGEWRTTVLYTKEGQLYLRPTYIFGCMREAAKYTKKGRSSLQKSVAATMQVLDDRILIDRFIPGVVGGKLPDELTRDQDEPVYLDICGVVNPSTRGRNVRYRVAAHKGWGTEFHLMWDKTIINRNQMEAISIDAGRLVGLADGRSVGFGRFEIVSFEIQE